MIWSFSSNGRYSVRSLHAVISNRGVIAVCVHAVWKIGGIQIVCVCVWLLTKNKLLTRYNLAKRSEVLDQSCLFFSERESICHLFSDPCVANV